jgi:uroporphyrinogen-III synthase
VTRAPIAMTTRPRGDAFEDCRYLEAGGLEAIAIPTLRIETRQNIGLGDLSEDVDAVILTSRHAANQITDPAMLAKPCFVVGEATASAAQAAGFDHIQIAAGAGQALMTLIEQSPYLRLCWPSATHSGFDIKTALEAHSNKQVERIIVYEAVTEDQLDEAAIRQICSGRPIIVLIHSGRAGEQFSHLLDQHDLAEYRKFMKLIVISSRAAGLCGQGWHNIHIVSSPLRSLMLAKAFELAGISHAETDHSQRMIKPLD